MKSSLNKLIVTFFLGSPESGFSSEDLKKKFRNTPEGSPLAHQSEDSSPEKQNYFSERRRTMEFLEKRVCFSFFTSFSFIFPSFINQNLFPQKNSYLGGPL